MNKLKFLGCLPANEKLNIIFSFFCFVLFCFTKEEQNK